MAWQDNYLQAKFRGVEFYISKAAYETGRRIVKHKYPRRDQTEYEDNGQDDKVFTLDAYVLGDDYFDKRNNLERVLNQGGTGLLIHPYRGPMTVVVPKVTINEATERGRLADFVITFELADSKVELTKAAPNTQWQISQAKEQFIDAYKENVFDIYDLLNKPAQAVKDARAVLDKGLSVIEKAKRVAGSVAEFKRELENTKGRFIAALNNIEYLANSFTDLTNWGTDLTSGLTLGVTSSNARDQLREQKQIVSNTSAITLDTPERYTTDPDYPSKQLQDMLLYAAVAAQIGIVAEIPYTTVEEAETEREDVFTTINTIMESDNITDDMFEALRDAKRAIYNDMESRTIDLPSIIDFDLSYRTNSLSLCYRLYGSLDNEQDIIDRNNLIHPGFLPVGQVQIKTTNE